MGEPNRWRAFAEDLAVFRRLTAPAEREEFTTLMQRAYAQQTSACAFVQQSPERQVSVRIRARCEVASSRVSTLSA